MSASSGACPRCPALPRAQVTARAHGDVRTHRLLHVTPVPREREGVRDAQVLGDPRMLDAPTVEHQSEQPQHTRHGDHGVPLEGLSRGAQFFSA